MHVIRYIHACSHRLLTNMVLRWSMHRFTEYETTTVCTSIGNKNLMKTMAVTREGFTTQPHDISKTPSDLFLKIRSRIQFPFTDRERGTQNRGRQHVQQANTKDR